MDQYCFIVEAPGASMTNKKLHNIDKWHLRDEGVWLKNDPETFVVDSQEYCLKII
jgi:hypothetical protein